MAHKPLLQLCADQAALPAAQIVYRNRHHAVSWHSFNQRVGELIARFRHYHEPQVAVFYGEAGTFLETLFALWRLGKIPVLPGDTLPATLRAVSGRTNAFIGDFPEPSTGQLLDEPLPEQCPQPDDTAVVVYTSGSSGEPQAITKSFAQLDAECQLLESTFGAMADSAVVMGSVSHQHMYGLIFRVLWPLQAGRTLLAQELKSLATFARHAGSESVILVSSPVHLKHVSSLADEAPAQGQTALVFSSGAPLPTGVAAACREHFGAPIVEIYGSTETGAAAFRQQQQHSAWQLLPGVTAAIEGTSGRLRIKGPTVQSPDGVLTADTAAAKEGERFSLLGRIDRIAKVGGKRVSLTAMEKALAQHAWVEASRLIALPGRSGRIGAAVQLSAEGRSALIDRGKLAVNRILAQALKNVAHPAGLPRYWRYVPRLPVNPQGKISTSEIERLFGAEPAPTLPRIIQASVEESAGHSELQLSLPADLLYFSGHFPAQPVLPGVVQIDWAIRFGREHFGSLGEFSQLEAVKFHHVITPDTTLTLALEYKPDTGKLLFRYCRGDHIFSSGRIVFAGGQRP